MLTKASTSVSRELDLVKFIQRQRLTTFTTLTSFNGRQKFIADKMATNLIRESSDMCDTSENDFKLDKENVQDIEKYSYKTFQSSNIVDQRLIQVYQCKRWKDNLKYNKGMSSAFSKIVPINEVADKQSAYQSSSDFSSSFSKSENHANNPFAPHLDGP